MTRPSDEAERRVLKDLDIASNVMAVRWPKSVFLGCKSTDLDVDMTVQTEIVQSEPAVIRVFESANCAVDNCPM